jgi:hypothetical protein
MRPEEGLIEWMSLEWEVSPHVRSLLVRLDRERSQREQEGAEEEEERARR